MSGQMGIELAIEDTSTIPSYTTNSVLSYKRRAEQTGIEHKQYSSCLMHTLHADHSKGDRSNVAEYLGTQSGLYVLVMIIIIIVITSVARRALCGLTRLIMVKRRRWHRGAALHVCVCERERRGQRERSQRRTRDLN